MRHSKAEIAGFAISALGLIVGLFSWFGVAPTQIIDFFNGIKVDIRIVGAIVAIAASFFLGWFLRGALRQGKRTSETVSKTDIEEQNRQFIMHLRESDKRLLKAVALKREIYCMVDGWSSHFYGDTQYLEQFIDIQTIEGRRLKLTPTPLLDNTIKEYQELFSVISDKSIDDNVIYDPNKREVKHVFGMHELVWWWYTDDPKIKEAQDIAIKKATEEFFGTRGLPRS